MKVAVVGATGLVGRKMLEILEERKFPVDELILLASPASVGKKIHYGNQEIEIVSSDMALAAKPDIALFSAGGSLSKELAPKFASLGCRVIDNSSAWRMEADIPLIVPEINATVIRQEDFIIANPNCSTIQLVMALYPLQKKYGLKRLVVSTYQSVTGTGQKAVEQWENERAGLETSSVYPHPIDQNCLPECDVFLENGYTREEMKVENETRKILNLPGLLVTATAVRVPVDGGHSESVNLQLLEEFDIEKLSSCLADMPGLVVQDDPVHHLYPMPLYAKGRDEVFVGRIRRDDSQAKTLNMWVVSDNLRKGAATNAVQIAEYLLQMGWIN